MAIPPTHGQTPNEPRPKGGEDQAHGRSGRLDLNHASKSDLISAGLSERSAERVLRYRDEHSGFETWADFDGIPIPPQELDALRPQVQI